MARKYKKINNKIISTKIDEIGDDVVDDDDSVFKLGTDAEQ